MAVIVSGGDSFTASDLVRAAAERSIAIPVIDDPSTTVDTPRMSGTVIAETVQPGLILSARDITFREAGTFSTTLEPMLMCGILLSGDSEPLEIPGHSAVAHVRDRLTLLGFGDPAQCRRACRAGQTNRAFAIVLTQPFFARFENVIADDGVAALHGMLEPGFRIRTMSASREVLAIANQLFKAEFGGALQSLFHESAALRCLLEAVAGLRDETRAIGLVGRRTYDRLRHARDILDNALVDPPSTLELARRLGTNITSLQAGFKAAFGTTIFGYLRGRRLEMARVLIEEHNLGIADAGFRVGFTNAAAFSTSYRRYFGEPPTGYRSRTAPPRDIR